MTRTFKEYRQTLQMAERSNQDENNKINQVIETNKKLMQDKFTKVNSDMADKISRVMGSVLDCQN